MSMSNIIIIPEEDTGLYGMCTWEWECAKCKHIYCSGCSLKCPHCDSKEITMHNIKGDELSAMLASGYRLKES